MNVTKWILSPKLLIFVIIIVFFAVMPVYGDETVNIFVDEEFETFVDDTTKEAGYELNFSFLLPPYKNATLFLDYTNEIGGTIIERCKVKEISVFVDSEVVLSKKYSGVQALTLKQSVLVTPDINHTGRLFVYGTSDTKLMGTINLRIEYIVSNGDGIFNFNPFDFGANWLFYCIIIVATGISITALAVRRRRRGGDEV